MQKDLQEMKRGLGIAQTRYNHLNYRVNQLKAYTDQWMTLEGQLDFIRYDLLHNDYLLYLHLYDDLKAIGNTEKDVLTACDRWAAAYEGCAKYTYDARRQQALDYWVTFYPDSAGRTVAQILEETQEKTKEETKAEIEKLEKSIASLKKLEADNAANEELQELVKEAYEEIK